MPAEVKLPEDPKELIRVIGEAMTGMAKTEQADRDKLARMRFHVVVIPDSGDSKVSTFDTRDDMLIFLRGLDPHTSVRIIEGLRWQLLKGSPKQLQDPDGNKFDIFPRDSEIDEDGRLDGYDSSRVMSRILKPSLNGDHVTEGAGSSERN